MKFVNKKDITLDTRYVKVFFNGDYQYTIQDEHQMNNIRLWAIKNGVTGSVTFGWEGHVLTLAENGDLSDWPVGMFDSAALALIQMVKWRKGDIVDIQLIK
jgi:hypothetical protein